MLKNLVQSTANFLKDDFNKILVVLLLVVGAAALLFFSPQAQAESTEGASFIHFFYLSTCPHCHDQMEKLNPVLEKNYDVNIISHEVSTQEGNALFEKVCLQKGLEGFVPLTLVGDKAFVGYSEEIGTQIEAAVKECKGKECPDPLTGETCKTSEQNYTLSVPVFGTIDARAMSLPALSVVLGLVDGFNPCAMWVLVYLIALVVELNDRKRIWLIVGSFVFASAVLYFLFMTAWLNAFLLVGFLRPVTILVGLVALGGGILGAKEWWQTRGQPLVCKVESAEDQKKTMSEIQKLVSAPLTWATFIGIVALAFVVNSVEFVCSAAIPAVFTQVLALSNLSFWEHYFYIALYDFFFMLDDLVIFGLAAFAVSGGLGEKYARHCKIIGGTILLVLGVLLLFAPQLLR